MAQPVSSLRQARLTRRNTVPDREVVLILSESQARLLKLVPLTAYGRPSETVLSVNGEIRYDDWLKNEQNRIMRARAGRSFLRSVGTSVTRVPYQVALVRNRAGDLALFTNYSSGER